MRTKIFTCAVILICFTVVAPSSSAGGNTETWPALLHITRTRVYWLVTHDFKCYEGRILKIGEQSMTFKLLDLTTITIDRSDVLRFGEGVDVRLTAYSGRSSWLDVTEIPLNTKQLTRVLMKNGKTREGKKVSFTDSGITLLERGKLVVIAKNEISKVYFDRLRPLSEEDQYALDELAYFVVFDPKFWITEMNAGPKIPLLLYDAATTEDDAPIRCEPKKLN